jgi:hypothetical protein
LGTSRSNDIIQQLGRKLFFRDTWQASTIHNDTLPGISEKECKIPAGAGFLLFKMPCPLPTRNSSG